MIPEEIKKAQEALGIVSGIPSNLCVMQFLFPTYFFDPMGNFYVHDPIKYETRLIEDLDWDI